jgi:hypothetical protein
MAEAVEDEILAERFAPDAVGHRQHDPVLERAHRGEALRGRPRPAPDLALIGVGDPVGAVDDDLGAELDQAPCIVREDQVVADGEAEPAERGLDDHRPVAGPARDALGGEEMRLVVEGEEASIRGEEKLRVPHRPLVPRIGADGEVDAVGARDRGEAPGGLAVRRLGELGQALAEEIARGRAFGKDDELVSEPARGRGEVGGPGAGRRDVAGDAVHLRHRDRGLQPRHGPTPSP